MHTSKTCEARCSNYSLIDCFIRSDRGTKSCMTLNRQGNIQTRNIRARNIRAENFGPPFGSFGMRSPPLYNRSGIFDRCFRRPLCAVGPGDPAPSLKGRGKEAGGIRKEKGGEKGSSFWPACSFRVWICDIRRRKSGAIHQTRQSKFSGIEPTTSGFDVTRRKYFTTEVVFKITYIFTNRFRSRFRKFYSWCSSYTNLIFVS